jgi:dTMP kinase
MFVVFEGIDGSGKTTLSNLVAVRLRERGLVVEHVREGGTFASSVTQAMRELGRDNRNLALSPRAELMLYLAREVQLLDEATRPALARADVVIADRFVSTPEVLAVSGRGLPADEVAALVAAAAGGVRPDLTVLVDVEPHISRARRQAAKLAAGEHRPPSRKGLAGPALQRRLREGYRALAEREAASWVVVDNTDADLDAMVDALAELVQEARTGGLAAARAQLGASSRIPRPPPRPEVHDRASARAALLAWIDRRERREPGLAAYFLDGLYGPDLDERRRALADRAPHVIAAGLKYLDDPVSWELRHRLADAAPREVARSIVGPAAAHPDAAGLLRALVARDALGVSEALWGRDDELAWELRARLVDAGAADVMSSLGGVPGERAWRMREAWLAERGGPDRLPPDDAARACASVTAISGERAWEIRKAARRQAPVAALESTLALTDERAWRWRERYLERAPKVVMKSLVGITDPRAWDLRERVELRCEEVMDSIAGLDDPRAWRLREGALERWPASVIKSLGPLAEEERGRALIAAALAHAPADVALWRQVAAGPRHR